jgi:hypothetical protein
MIYNQVKQTQADLKKLDMEQKAKINDLLDYIKSKGKDKYD